ncbi:MAG: type II toxin-antitoxin system Phd/YefM family antitoxin [Acidobacteriota bacterium]
MKITEVGSFEAKNRLSELLRQVEKGERVFITRRGKRVALLVSARDALAGVSQEPKAARLLSRFRDFRQGARRGPESLKTLVEEGRR